MVISPQKLWESYSRSLLPLEVSEIGSKKLSYGSEKRVYFNGEATAMGCTRVYCRHIVPEEETNKAILIFLSPEYDIHAADFSIFTEKGMAVIAVDYAGKTFGRERYTIYPNALSFANYNSEKIYEPVHTTSKSCWYVWTTVCMRAITYAENAGYEKVALLGVGIGGSFTYRAAAIDDFPCCAVSLFSPGFFPQSSDAEFLAVSASLSASSYSPLIKIPYLEMCCSNDLDSSLDSISELRDLSTDKSILYIEPRKDRAFTTDMAKNLEIFLAYYLSENREEEIAPKVSLSSYGEGKNLYFSLKCEDTLEKVELFVSHGITNPAYRNWRAYTTEKVGEYEYLGRSEVYLPDKPVYGFARITTKSGFLFSTPIVKKIPSALKIIPATIAKQRLIYESDMGVDDFFAVNASENPELKLGPYDIQGISAKSGLCTYKLGDVVFGGTRDGLLQLLVFSSVKQTVTFSVTDEINYNTYVCTKTVSPENDWNKLLLSPSDFKSGEGNLSGWDKAIFLRIDYKEEILINSLLWV